MDVTPSQQPSVASSTRPPARRRRWWPILLLVAILAAALIWHPWNRAKRVAPGLPPQAIGEAAATTASVPIVLNALGTVTPLATVTVQTQVSGQLTEVGFKEGQEVRKGDFLAQIDPRPYQIALDQAQGTLARDQALLKEARLDLARYQTLNRQDSIARQQVTTQQSLVGQYLGDVQSDSAAVDTQKLNLIYCHIVAPVDGRVGLRLVDPGNYVQTGSSTGLVVITQLKPITVIFTLPEDDIPRIMQRMASGAALPVTAINRADTTPIATGTLATLDNQIDVTTGTVKLRATFANDNEALFPNQFVNVNLLVDTLSNAIVVPTQAIQRGAPGTFVYLVNANNTVSVRPVTIGPATATTTSVTKGLSAGDKVVIDGADRLRDGAKIVVPPAAGSAAAAAPRGAGRGKAQ